MGWNVHCLHLRCWRGVSVYVEALKAVVQVWAGAETLNRFNVSFEVERIWNTNFNIAVKAVELSVDIWKMKVVKKLKLLRRR